MENFPGEGVLYSRNSTGGGVSGSWKFQGGRGKNVDFPGAFYLKIDFPGVF